MHLPASLELALEHVEGKARIALSRQIGTPNIAAKGKLEARTVLVPNALLNPKGVAAQALTPKPLVQEVLSRDTDVKGKEKEAAPAKSLLKGSSTSTTRSDGETKKPIIEELHSAPALSVMEGTKSRVNAPAPRWQWTKQGEQIEIIIDVPKLVRSFDILR